MVCAQRAGLARQAATLVAVAVCAFAVASYYQASAANVGVELLQENTAHAKHAVHRAMHKAMKVSSFFLP